MVSRRGGAPPRRYHPRSAQQGRASFAGLRGRNHNRRRYVFGVLPKLLGPRSKRPPIVLCGTSILHWRREDGAPHFLGLLPATTQAQLMEYAAISEEYDRVVNQPLVRGLNPLLKEFGVGPLS